MSESAALSGNRQSSVERNTKETQIAISIDLDGSGQLEVDTGLPFLDHMLDQVACHGLINLSIKAKGDLEIDPHHTVEDIASPSARPSPRL